MRRIITKPAAVLIASAVLIGSAGCGRPAVAPDELAAGEAKFLTQEACAALIPRDGSAWDATVEAVSYAEQAVDASGGRAGSAGNVAELYFAANLTDLYAASRTPATKNRKQLSQLRTAVSRVCQSFDPSFPTATSNRRSKVGIDES